MPLLNRTGLANWFRPKGLEGSFDFLYHVLVFRVGEIHFARVHLESAAIVGSIHILWGKMEVEVGEFVAVSAIVDFLRVENLLHGTGGLSHISHESVSLLVAQLVQVVHVPVIAHEAASVVSLLLEKENT